MNPNGAHHHDRADDDDVARDHDHDHGPHEHHDHEHGEHEQAYALEAREKQVVMAFIEALVEERLSINARRAVFGILSLDPSLRNSGE